MKHIIKTTNYWLFKPTHPTSSIYYVRSAVDGLAPTWFTGYENHMGFVSSVGGDLSKDTKDILEKEWEAAMEDEIGFKRSKNENPLWDKI